MTNTDSYSGGLPSLEEGLRWSVEESAYGGITIHLQKYAPIMGFRPWKTIRERTAMSVWDDDITDPKELREKTIRVANEMLSEYTKRREVEAAKTAVLDSFTAKEAR